MNRRAGHVLGISEQLKIVERTVFVIAIAPPDAMPAGNWTVRIFPDAAMHELPNVSIAESADAVRDLPTKITV